MYFLAYEPKIVYNHTYKNNIMSQDRLIKLACQKCKRINYWSSKNKKLVVDKIEINKYCKWCKAHTPHKEVKK